MVHCPDEVARLIYEGGPAHECQCPPRESTFDVHQHELDRWCDEGGPVHDRHE